ncbi:DUF6612 family protein [Halobacillus litoralis]|uniref:DUF6612 family protein n=1 Tax=Halobacillus litoralis TaxID=45668 RepID=UPI001CFF29DF|nr:DUF6612 family protein [Halobacillus litoralis]
MKKMIRLSLALVVLFVLPFQVSAAEMSSEEILKKSNDAMKELESYTIKTTSKQTMPMTNGGNDQPLTTKSVADVTLNPLAMHMTSEIAGNKTESYLTKEGYFTEVPGEGWVKLSGDLGEELQNTMMAEGQLSQAMPLAEEMTVTEDGGTYVLTYEGDGEKLMKMSMQAMQSSGGSDQGKEMQSMMEQLMKNVQFENVSYEVMINKETHYMTGMMMDLEMKVDNEGQTMTIQTSTDITIDNFNGVGSIEIPQEVLDNAQSLEETVGGEMPDTATSNPSYALAGAALALVAGGVLVYRRKVSA